MFILAEKTFKAKLSGVKRNPKLSAVTGFEGISVRTNLWSQKNATLGATGKSCCIFCKVKI